MSNNSTSINETCGAGTFDSEYHTMLITMATFICASNCLVITLFLTNSSLRSSGNYLLFSLALSDIAVGLIGIPMNIWCEVELKWKACLSSYSTNRFIAISTVYHILWITLEKYTAIVFPLQHKSKFDHTRVKIIILCTWFASVFVTCIELNWLVGGHDHPKKEFSDDVKQKELIYNIFTFVSCFVLPVALMTFAYTSIFLRILRQHSSILRKHIKHTGDETVRVTKRMPQKMKSALLFFALLAIFVGCWFWWFFATVCTMLFQPDFKSSRYIDRIMTVFRFSTSFINPLLYTFFKRDFNKALRKIINGARLSPLIPYRTLRRLTRRSLSQGSDTTTTNVYKRTDRTQVAPVHVINS